MNTSTAQGRQPTPVRRVYIYARVSSRTQAGPDRISLTAQLEACSRLATEMFPGVRQRHHTEIGSAREPGRLDVQTEIWGTAPRGSAVVVYSFDRIARNVRAGLEILEEAKRRDLRIVSFSESEVDYRTRAGKRLVMQLLMTAEEESELISERVRRGIEYIRQNGGCPGRVPYGYEVTPGDRTRRALPCLREQRVLAFMRALATGDMAVREINVLLRSLVPDNRTDLHVPLVIDDENGNVTDRIVPGAIDAGNICDLLNEYEIVSRGGRGGKWTPSLVEKRLAQFDEMKDNVEIQDEIRLDIAKAISLMDSIVSRAMPAARDNNVDSLADVLHGLDINMMESKYDDQKDEKGDSRDDKNKNSASRKRRKSRSDNVPQHNGCGSIKKDGLRRSARLAGQERKDEEELWEYVTRDPRREEDEYDYENTNDDNDQNDEQEDDDMDDEDIPLLGAKYRVN